MLGRQIKKIRMIKGISQVELARQLGISKQSVSNWENDNVMPSVDMLKKICQIFSCSSDYLLELNSGNTIVVDTADLTVEQTENIRRITNDLASMNRMMFGCDKKLDA